MSKRDYVIAYAFRTGVEEHTVRLDEDEFRWWQRFFSGTCRLSNGGRCAEIRLATAPPSPDLEAPADPAPPPAKRARRRSRPIGHTVTEAGGAA